jgi:FG-GAP-like repeat/ASPIC and UnbV
VRPCAGDVNGDGRFDLVMANYGRNGLFFGRPDGTFDDVGEAARIAIDARYDACAFTDFDNDGRLDLFVNGTVTGGVSYRDYLFRNAGHFYDDVTPDALRALHADHGVQWADFDGDGDEDLALTGSRPDGMHLLLRNLLPSADARRSLHVRVLNRSGKTTRAGAEVRLYDAGTRRVRGTRLVDTGSGYDAQNEMPVHFGVGAGTGRLDVEVIWPAAGRRVSVTKRNVRPTGQILTIKVG